MNLEVVLGKLLSLISCLVFGEALFYRFYSRAEDLSLSVSYVLGVGDSIRPLDLSEVLSLTFMVAKTTFAVGDLNGSAIGVIA